MIIYLWNNCQVYFSCDWFLEDFQYLCLVFFNLWIFAIFFQSEFELISRYSSFLKNQIFLRLIDFSKFSSKKDLQIFSWISSLKFLINSFCKWNAVSIYLILDFFYQNSSFLQRNRAFCTMLTISKIMHHRINNSQSTPDS